MTATESKQQIKAEELISPSYESVREVVLNWPPAARAKLMHDMINGVMIPESVTSSPSSQFVERNQTSNEQSGDFDNILDIAGRWNFGYQPDDDEIDMLLAEARLEKYAPELLPEMQKQWEANRLTKKRLETQAANNNKETWG